MVLTPDSTGSTPSLGGDSPQGPNTKSSTKTLKPFSRSAAKRESVMALGSIEHLQHYFTKTGLSANRDLFDKPHYGLVPAIGGPAYLPSFTASSSSISIIPTPPDPISVQSRPSFPPNQPKTYETDPDSLLRGVVDDLTAVTRVWNLDTPDHFPSPSAADQPIVTISLSTPVDVLELLKTTTRAIRSTGNYLVSLPDDSALSPVQTRAQFRPAAFSTATATAHSRRPPPRQQHATRGHDGSSPHATKGEGAGKDRRSSKGADDASVLVRKSALEVLAALREVEERYRLPLSDEAYDAMSDGGPRVTMVSPEPVDHELDARHHDHDGDLSIMYSLVQIQVGDRVEEVPVWEDEESDSDLEEKEKEKRELWDERLVLGSGWLYVQDVKMEEMQREREVVKGYLDVVDRVIFGAQREGDGEERIARKAERGWERERRRAARRVSSGDGDTRRMRVAADNQRRVSAGVVELLRGMSLTEEPEEMDASFPEGQEEEEQDDEELPDWAKRGNFIGDDLGRAHALLSAFLPRQLLPALGPASPRTDFLSSLSSGQLLCVAYNACVRRSKKPWGYVSKDSIHDIIALERAQAETKSGDGTGRKGWTFRRTDNLRLWVGALKLRYMLPIQTPHQPLNPGTLNSLQLLGSGPAHNHNNVTLVSGPLLSPTKPRPAYSSAEPAIEFDARVVARKDSGWEKMLEQVVVQWVDKVVEEKRSLC
ncbi:hypothetical protein APHAL10511_008456 [Amanita phalloides]|nr:hypothetical protein APHAL10511_008456 [Amanita phalloides]